MHAELTHARVRSRRGGAVVGGLLCSLLLAGCMTSEPETRPEAARVRILPQAVPVQDLYRALRADDLELFKTVFSASKSREKAKQGWAAEFKAYRGFWRGPRKRSYRYEGEARAGRVHVREGDAVIWRARVVLEAGCWRLDEN